MFECHLVHPSAGISIKSSLTRLIAVLKKGNITPDGSFWFLRITEVIDSVTGTIWLIENQNGSLFQSLLVCSADTYLMSYECTYL